MNEKPDELPEEFNSYEEAAEFWDTHDTTDYWDEFKTIEVKSELRNRYFEEDFFNIAVVDNPLEALVQKPYVDAQLKEQILQSNLVLIPEEDSERIEGPYFRNGTGELFRFLQNSNSPNLNPEIAVRDQDYQELALYADWLLIGGFVITSIIAPIGVRLISSYLEQTLGLKFTKTDIKAEITVIQKQRLDGSQRKAIKVTYDGPANQFEPTVLTAIDQASKGFASLEDSKEVKD